MQRVFAKAADLPPALKAAADAPPVYELPEERIAFELESRAGVHYVTGMQIERAAAMTFWDYDEAVTRFHRTLDALGVTEALEGAGIQDGDTVFIGEHEMEWST